MIPICLLVEAVAVEICSRFIVDKMAQIAEGGKAKLKTSKSFKNGYAVVPPTEISS